MMIDALNLNPVAFCKPRAVVGPLQRPHDAALHLARHLALSCVSIRCSYVPWSCSSPLAHRCA
jgi:hypothetical protein